MRQGRDGKFVHACAAIVIVMISSLTSILSPLPSTSLSLLTLKPCARSSTTTKMEEVYGNRAPLL